MQATRTEGGEGGHVDWQRASNVNGGLRHIGCALGLHADSYQQCFIQLTVYGRCGISSGGDGTISGELRHGRGLLN